MTVGLGGMASRNSLEVELGKQKLLAKMFNAGETPSLEHYELLEKLGEGAMGVVFAAYDPKLDRTVAIKWIKAELGPEGRNLLEKEARAMARVNHPNVVQIYGLGVHKGRSFIVMEYVEGPNLREWLAATKRSVEDIIATFVGAGRGLEAAHAKKLVHRDFKPANVMVGVDGRVRVTDFGLARLDPSKDETLLDRGEEEKLTTSAGTPAYMSPEQVRGHWVDELSDQFSFCVALWEALHGELPYPVPDFKGRTWDRGRRPRAHGNSKVPKQVRKVLGRGLSPIPVERFPSMTELLSALQDAMAGHVPVDASVPDDDNDDDAVWPSRVRPGRRWLVAAAIVAGLGFTGVTLMCGQDSTEIIYQACNIRVDGNIGVISNAYVKLDRGQVWQVDVDGSTITFKCPSRGCNVTVVLEVESLPSRYVWASVIFEPETTYQIIPLADLHEGLPEGFAPPSPPPPERGDDAATESTTAESTTAESEGSDSDGEATTKSTTAESTTIEPTTTAESEGSESDGNPPTDLPIEPPIASKSAAMSAVERGAKACGAKHLEAVTSYVKISYTIRPDGTATAKALPPTAGQAIGDCVAAAFEAQRFPVSESGESADHSFKIR